MNSMSLLLTSGLWLAALAAGLLAGTFFAFSAFVMPALHSVSGGADAMVQINRLIVRSSFMPVFLGGGALAATLSLMALKHLDEPWSLPTLAAGVFMLIVVLGVTMAFNVPLNDALDAVARDGQPQTAWDWFYGPWLWWNHVRTAGALAALAFYIIALIRL
jgi:uncharacterized membrane protein